MFEPIEIYILRSREERRAHLDRSQSCIEIGGDSRIFRGLLAHFLKTTISENKRYEKKLAFVCHDCNNPKCSNVYHLYWGTSYDNYLDQVEKGTALSKSERAKIKYGETEYRKIMRENASKGGKAAGGKNRLSSEKKEIWKRAILDSEPDEFGWVSRVSIQMNCTHTHVRRLATALFPDNQFFKKQSSQNAD